MTLYVAIIGLGTLAGILFNVLFNKRLVFRIVGIVVTLITGTFACCVVLYPYYFFSSYNNLIIKLSLSAVLLIVIYVSARMIVNAVTSIRKDKAEAAKEAAAAEKEEISVLSHALKNRVKDIISVDKTVKNPAQRVSIIDNNAPVYAGDKAPETPGQADASKISAEQRAEEQSFMHTLKEAEDNILSESKAFADESRPQNDPSIVLAAGQAGDVSATQSVSESKLGILYEEPGQAEKTETKQGFKPADTASEYMQYEQPPEDAGKAEPDIQSVAEASADKLLGDTGDGSQEGDQPVEEIAEQSAARPGTEIISEAQEPAAGQQEYIGADGVQEEAAEANVEAAEPARADIAEAGTVSEPAPASVQNAAALDKYAAIIAKASELMEEGKYVYAAEMLQMCLDRSEDMELKKRAEILIIECFALSHQNSEAQKRWIEFLNKAYTLDETDKIKLKKAMSSL